MRDGGNLPLAHEDSELCSNSVGLDAVTISQLVQPLVKHSTKKTLSVFYMKKQPKKNSDDASIKKFSTSFPVEN